MASIQRDVKLAIRTLARSPLFAATTVLSLALGIGANTTVFTAMKRVVLDALPVPQPEQLVILHDMGVQEGHTQSDGMHSSFSYPQYRDLAAATKPIFSGLLARLGTMATLDRQEGSERIRCELVSGNYFNVLGVKPWRGRLLNSGDDVKAGGHPVAVLSQPRWQRSFGGDPRVVNSTIRVNGHAYVVVGIAPPGFYGVQIDSPPDVFIPMAMKAEITPGWNGLWNRLDHWATLMGRLQPGIGMTQAQAALSVIYPPIRDKDLAEIQGPSQQFLREFSRTHIRLEAGAKGYADLRAGMEQPLRFLSGMAAIVLLITIVNVANLLIARGAARRREMAVRLSIGAGRGALMWQALAESLVLATIGGALGIAMAYATTPALLRLFAVNLSETSLSAHPDLAVLAFMAGAIVFAGLAFGLMPAMQAARTDLMGALKTERVAGHGGGSLWFRRTLVGAQLAFSLLLATGALLFTSSLRNLRHLNAGFETEHLVTFKVDPASIGYSPIASAAFSEDLRARLQSLPYIRSASFAAVAVLEGDDWGRSITIEGVNPDSTPEVLLNGVSAGFLETLKIPLLAGRTIQERDPRGKVAVVNAAFAKRFFGGANPVGRRFQFGTEHGTPHFDWTIVGMVADSKYADIRGDATPFAYVPNQTDESMQTRIFYVRTSGDDRTAMREIRATVQHANPRLPIYALGTLDETIARSFSSERALSALSGVFAGLAILLAVVGLYGVISYSVVRRRREFGIRMAVGATRGNVLAIVLRETAWIGVLSLAAALPFVFAGGRLIRSLLYGVQPNDPTICAVAALGLLIVAMASGSIPARQAALIDPNDALRAE